MTKEIILPMNEITDSVEMLHEKPNKGMPIFTWILVLLLAVALTLCCIGEIDYFIKANGVVRPNESVSTISSLMTGRIDTLNISEGDNVKKGDLLFKLDNAELEQSLSAYKKEKQRIEAENGYLNRLKESISNGENLFDKNSPDESAYYLKYEKYISDLQSLSEQYKNTSADTDNAADSAVISAESIKSQLAIYRKELSGLETLKSSVEANSDMFEEKSSVYAMQYADYTAAINAYDVNINQKKADKENAEPLFKAGGISQSEYDSFCRSHENAKLEKDKYISEFKLNIEQKITAAEKNISDLEYSLKGQNQSLSSYSEISHDEQLAAENMKLEMLSWIAESIKSNEANIISIEKQIDDIELNIRNAEVIAPIDGTVNMYADLSTADLVQSGQTIATIIPDTEGAYKLTMYLSSADISETEIGQSVRLRFAAYPYQEYGELVGTVKSISTDVRSSENGMSYYVAEVSIDDTMGLELVSGMECEARVVTKQRKIIYWLLEKLDFIDD